MKKKKNNIKTWIFAIFAIISIAGFPSVAIAADNNSDLGQEAPCTTVCVTNAALTGKTNGIEATINSYGSDYVDTKVDFKNLGDYASYEIEVQNHTDEDLVAKLSDANTEYVEITMTGAEGSAIVKKQSSTKLSVTVKYVKTVPDKLLTNGNFGWSSLQLLFGTPSETADYSSPLNPQTIDNIAWIALIFCASGVVLFVCLKKTRNNRGKIVATVLFCGISLATAINANAATKEQEFAPKYSVEFYSDARVDKFPLVTKGNNSLTINLAGTSNFYAFNKETRTIITALICNDFSSFYSLGSWQWIDSANFTDCNNHSYFTVAEGGAIELEFGQPSITRKRSDDPELWEYFPELENYDEVKFVFYDEEPQEGLQIAWSDAPSAWEGVVFEDSTISSTGPYANTYVSFGKTGSYIDYKFTAYNATDTDYIINSPVKDGYISYSIRLANGSDSIARRSIIEGFLRISYDEEVPAELLSKIGGNLRQVVDFDLTPVDPSREAQKITINSRAKLTDKAYFIIPDVVASFDTWDYDPDSGESFMNWAQRGYCFFEKGMTLREWVNSPYNKIGAQISRYSYRTRVRPTNGSNERIINQDADESGEGREAVIIHDYLESRNMNINLAYGTLDSSMWLYNYHPIMLVDSDIQRMSFADDEIENGGLYEVFAISF